MSKAEKGSRVKVHYTGTLDDGTEFDSSVGSEPLEFVVGDGMLLPLFEDAVVGLTAGESKMIKVPAEEGYGLKRDDLIVKIEKSKIPETIKPEIGMKLQTKTPEGNPMVLNITEVTDDFIIVDANHELAGLDLNFHIELVEIL